MRAAALLLVLLAGCTLDRRGLEWRCPLHRVELHEDLVPIVWGLPAEEFFKERVEFYPFAFRVYHGGCIPGPESRAWVRYCPECRAVESARRG